MIHLNISTLTSLTRHVLPGMLARRKGKILNVASVAGFQPGGPGMSVYYATKSYVLSFSHGIRRELRGTGVSVTVLCKVMVISPRFWPAFIVLEINRFLLSKRS